MAGAGYKLFNTGDVLTAAQVNTYLQEQVVMVFADSTARTTALSGVLAEGMCTYLKDTNSFEVYDGSAWVSASGDLTALTAGTGISIASSTGPVPTITNSMATEITASGDIIVGTGSGTFDNLPIGTTGQVLTADTTVSPYKVKWSTPASGGGMTLIQETVASANSSITFGSIAGTYKDLVLTWNGLYHVANGAIFEARINNDSGGNYYGITQNQNGATMALTADNAQTTINGAGTYATFGQQASATSLDQAMRGILEIENYASTTKIKTYRLWMFYKDNVGGNYLCSQKIGIWNSTSAVTSIDIVRTSGSTTLTNATNTSLRLYGVA